MRVLIIEDEQNASAYLQKLLNRVASSVEVLAVIDSVEDAINWLHNNTADLIFMDIELADGNCFEIFKHIEVKSPIIFTTAYDQYALDAFKVNSLDYLLKPIAVEDLERALHKFKSNQKSNQFIEIQSLINQLKPTYKNRCLVKKGNHFEFVDVNDIAYACSEDSLTFLYTFSSKRFIYSHTLEQLAKGLNPQKFFQINRKQLVNIENIKEVHPHFNQRQLIKLNQSEQGMEFLVSRKRISQFKEWLDS